MLILTSISPLQAGEWHVKGNIFQSFSYDDNVIMRENPEASTIYALTPTLKVSHQTDVSEITANASYGIQRYFDKTEFNRENQNYGISGRYSTENIEWAGVASYSLAPARDTAEQESGDFSTDSDRETFFVSPSVSFQLSELDRLTFLAHYTNTSYSTDELDNVESSTTDSLSDYVDKGLNLSWSRQFSELYTGSISIFYSNYKSSDYNREPTNQKESDSGGANISLTYFLSEKWEIFGTVGGRVTNTKRFNGGSKTSSGYLIDSGVNYKGEVLFAEFNVKQSLEPSSQGSLNDQFRISFDLEYKITERFSASLLNSYQESESVDSSDKRRNYTFNPSLSWKITPDWTLSGSYRYRYQKRPIDGLEETANSNLYMLSVNYIWQGLSVAR
ncbi:MAG: outer membrane beta-barrel protein [Methylococcales bacterium]|nr:outer membrane beta-barrel protein [Methylococcales bacterium]